MLFVLPAAWLAGTLADRMTSISASVPVVSGAADRAGGAGGRGPTAAAGSLPAALTCGLLHGCSNGGALAGAGSSGLAAVGIGCGVFVSVALVAGQVATLEKEWARIMVRVAGSWIGAIGLLMLGWAAIGNDATLVPVNPTNKKPPFERIE